MIKYEFETHNSFTKVAPKRLVRTLGKMAIGRYALPVPLRVKFFIKNCYFALLCLFWDPVLIVIVLISFFVRTADLQVFSFIIKFVANHSENGCFTFFWATQTREAIILRSQFTLPFVEANLATTQITFGTDPRLDNNLVTEQAF